MIFKEAFFIQLAFHRIVITYQQLDSMIGKLDFLPTENDPSTTGFQNHYLELLVWWKHEYRLLENMPMSNLTNQLNANPIHLGKKKNSSDYTNSIKEMKKILTKISTLYHNK